ncbi:cell division protein FtsB [Methylohalobius crimeensis]|uniref:cell division protein FtsB n=1 Tax=Methylohalobius crimeensis TaxID=244365 RepID=UPI0003B527D2|nr:cell division protein FtsB [Methylohalobius crimeensis]
MRFVIALLGLLLFVLQYRLWFGDGGFMERRRLQTQVAELKQEVAERRERNQALEAEVRDLKHNLAAVEERARRDLGMIEQGETFVMMVTRSAPEESRP